MKKTRELCQSILEQTEYQAIQQRIEAFKNNDAAQSRYQALSAKQSALQHKQEQGQELSDAEIDDFDRDRQAFFEDPVASGFVDAQQELHEVKKAITQLVTKTFEMGRVPRPDEIQAGSCGHGCGCH